MSDTAWGQVRRRGRPRASDSTATRERILHAARKVFAESGYESSTFQAIAVEIGLTRPAINNYFSSKSALYAEVVGRAGDAVRAAAAVASAAPTLAEQVLEFLRVTVRGEDADPALAGFLVHSAMEERNDAVALIESFIREAVGSAISRGELPPGIDTDELTDTLMGVVWGTAFQVSRGRNRDSVRADRMLGQLGALLDHGLRQAG